MPTSRESLVKTFQNNFSKNESEISIYKGALTLQSIVRCSVKVKKAFPDLPTEFFEIFQEMLKSEGFTDERLMDSVDNVIKTCVYPKPTIAQFLSWDMKIKVLTYEDMLNKTNEFGGDLNAGRIFQSQYKPIQFPDREKPVWVHVDDIKRYNLKT